MILRCLNIPLQARFSTTRLGLNSSVPITISTTTYFFVLKGISLFNYVLKILNWAIRVILSRWCSISQLYLFQIWHFCFLWMAIRIDYVNVSCDMVNGKIHNVVAVFLKTSPILLWVLHVDDTIKVNINAVTILLAPDKSKEPWYSYQGTQWRIRYDLFSLIAVINNIDISINCITLTYQFVI